MTDPRTVPVIVGIGDVRSGKFGSPAEPREPLELIADATAAALADSGVAGIGSRVDTIYAVKTASWSYDDMPGLIASRIGADASRTCTSSIGGHWPAELLDRIGSNIATGSSSVALLVGGEAQASVTALAKLGVDPTTRGWRAAPGGPPTFGPDDLGSAEMQRAGALTPTRVYPLFENRFCFDAGVTPEESRTRSAQMYEKFSAVAAAHPTAWITEPRTSEQIATAGPQNRLVSDVYPLMMNAMPFVDQAAAVLVCSLAAASEFGVPADRIVYLWGGAGASDDPDVLARSTFGQSTALNSAVTRTLTQAGVVSGDLGMIDAYSCFPVVPKLLVDTLGLPDHVVPSVLGGHSFFGGPLSSYTLHSIAEVTRLLRSGVSEAPALVHGNGGYLTHQHTVLLSRTPHSAGYVGQSTPVVLPSAGPAALHGYSGDARITTATVDFDRNGTPRSALIVAEVPDGQRVAGHTGPEDAKQLIDYTNDGSRSWIGAPISITDNDGTVSVTLATEERV